MPYKLFCRVLLAFFLINLCSPLNTNAQGSQEENAAFPPRIIRKSGGELQAEAITRIDPVYPFIARAAGVYGPVEVELVIGRQGDVISAKALDGHALLKNAAVVA